MAFRLSGVIISTVVSLGVASGLILGARVLDRPEAASVSPADPLAGLRVQHVLAQLILRQEGLSRQREPLSVTAGEVNVFLAKHVSVRDIPAWPPVVRLGDGVIEVAGRTSPRRLLDRWGGGRLLTLVPAAVLDVEVWLVARGHLTVRDGRGELATDGAGIGRQAIPVGVLWRLLGARPAELLVWRMPRVIERVEVRPDRVVIITRGG